MEAKDYKDKCLKLLDRFDEMIKSGPKYDGYEGEDELMREFRHLVYAFDKNLPLNRELDVDYALKLQTPFMGESVHESSKNRIRGFMTFFIQYLDEYCI